MRLNHLEIAGFKSFPERAELAFDDGVTAIVGPNGCGKSNVIDAITWVLGEQSARSLRGERMEDVIFSGSDARRPTAAAEVRIQLSEVTAALTRIDNRLVVAAGTTPPAGPAMSGGNGHGHALVADEVPASVVATLPGGAPGDTLEVLDDLELDDGPAITRDVEVGRRLYRSGESEYLIDGQVCRLRDIQDLLMDSGVGVKAYAVIEQGRIGQILGARPAERRQLLEEAAGVTKYKNRRRAAELKLEAAQQNLTRVDDIVFEVEKQRGALKRQAAKARRYRRLREELRRWEKVSFTRRSLALTQAIAEADRRLADATARERGAAAGVASLESALERQRLELAEADQAATTARETAHQRELELERRQQQIDFDTRRAAELDRAVTGGAEALHALEERSEPISTELAAQRVAHTRCVAERDAAATRLRDAERAFAEAQRAIEGREGDVEAARSEVYAAINAATALQNVVANARAAHARIADTLAKLDAEHADVTGEITRIDVGRDAADATARRVRERLDDVRRRRADNEATLGAARADVERRAREVRAREHDVAATRARVVSLEELEAARADYEDAARVVLAAADRVLHQGSVADHLEVDRAHERAVEACLGRLLQYVVVASRADALAGVALATSSDAGRCGFVINDGATDGPSAPPPHPELRPLAEVVTVAGPGAAAVRRILQRRWLAPSAEVATVAARLTHDPIVTLDGVVAEGPYRLHGGAKRGARGVLTAKREVRELAERLEADSAALERLQGELASIETTVAETQTALAGLQRDEHALEKELVGLEMQLGRLEDERSRLAEKRALVETERRQATEERQGLEAKEAEARDSIARLETEQRSADERFMGAQGSLLEARDSVETLGERVTDAKADHAALAERAGALASDVRRLEDQTSDLRQRISARELENARAATERQQLLQAVAEAERQRDADIVAFDELRREITRRDAEADRLRVQIAARHEEVRVARQTLDAARADVGRHEVARATADGDLTHLAALCVETLQLSLADVTAEIDRLEADGPVVPDAALIRVAAPAAEADEGDDVDDAVDETRDVVEAGDTDGAAEAVGVDDILTRLREKIDRLGPVNMMAIDQFDELEDRHAFLTTQRKDLLDSIAATGDAITRIDATTRARFQDAFTAVNDHFQHTFETLFGGGRAGLVLLDESDVLESGIDIIAQPPGKRLQSIQLLSGGEKALTAMALMFAIFQYKPSPFCLLDEIDAPLDDANIGRFVDMLRGLQDRTQFVLVTHNRKTMEIADRLYGVTMEEPGVSKLISVKMS